MKGTASEATLVALLSARARMMNKFSSDLEFDSSAYMGKLVAYASGIKSVLQFSLCVCENLNTGISVQNKAK